MRTTRSLRGLRSVVDRFLRAKGHHITPDATTTRVEPLENRMMLSGGGGHGHGRDALDVVYVATNNPNPGQNAVLAYQRDPDTGALTEMSPGRFLTGGTGFFNDDERLGPDDHDQELITTPDHKFLLVVNQGSDSISVFRINKKDGRLKLVGKPVDSHGDQPVSLGLSGKTLVVVNRGGQLPGETDGSDPNYTSFRLSNSGKLDHLRGSTVEAPPGSSPTQALISRDGKFVFGSNLFAQPFPPPPGFPPFVPPFASELEVLRIGRNGKLSRAPGAPVGFPAPAPPFILGLQIHPTQNVLYTGFVVAGQVGVWTYDDAGAVQFQGAVGAQGLGICWLTVDTDGRYLYGTNSTDDSVEVFSLADPVHPVQIQNVPLAGPKQPLASPGPAIFDTTPFQLSLSPDDDTLYVLNHETTLDNSNQQGNRVHILDVLDDGKLSQVGGPLFFAPSAVPARGHPLGILAL